MDYAKESLRMHYEWKGKLEMVNRAAVDSAAALSLAYTPGCALSETPKRAGCGRPPDHARVF